MVGWYNGDSVDVTNNKWMDISGANNHGTIINSIGFELFNGSDVNNEFYINGEKVVTGTTSTKITFSPLVFPDHTILSLCRYANQGTKRIILQADNYRAAYGFYGSYSGVAYEEAWITHSSRHTFDNDWLISVNSMNLYRGQGVDLTVSPRNYNYYTTLSINTGHSSWQSYTRYVPIFHFL